MKHFLARRVSVGFPGYARVPARNQADPPLAEGSRAGRRAYPVVRRAGFLLEWVFHSVNYGDERTRDEAVITRGLAVY
jgi:hypothetical protein